MKCVHAVQLCTCCISGCTVHISSAASSMRWRTCVSRRPPPESLFLCATARRHSSLSFPSGSPPTASPVLQGSWQLCSLPIVVVQGFVNQGLAYRSRFLFQFVAQRTHSFWLHHLYFTSKSSALGSELDVLSHRFRVNCVVVCSSLP